MVYPALLPLMRTPRLPVVDWTDAPPADLNGLVRFAERRNLVSARPLAYKPSDTSGRGSSHCFWRPTPLTTHRFLQVRQQTGIGRSSVRTIYRLRQCFPLVVGEILYCLCTIRSCIVVERAASVFVSNTPLMLCYVFMLCSVCMLYSVYSVFIVPTGILRLLWLRGFHAYSSVVRQMPGYTSQRRGTASTLPN